MVGRRRTGSTGGAGVLGRLSVVFGAGGLGVTKTGGVSRMSSAGARVAPPLRVVSVIAPAISAACASALAIVPPVRQVRLAFDSSRTLSMVCLRVVVVGDDCTATIPSQS